MNQPLRLYSGANLRGWRTVVGDGLYSAPGEAPVNDGDVQTVHYDGWSEARANVHRRRIMAHNITYLQIVSPQALTVAHRAAFEFRLPYLPVVGRYDRNAQTIEAGLSVWDGAASRRSHTVAFQWGLNPWANFGTLRCWRPEENGSWRSVAGLPVDTAWHQVELQLDVRREQAALAIDGRPFPSSYTVTTGPTAWGSEIGATLSLEAISIDPGVAAPGALHAVLFRNWRWEWSTSRPAADSD